MVSNLVKAKPEVLAVLNRISYYKRLPFKTKDFRFIGPEYEDLILRAAPLGIYELYGLVCKEFPQYKEDIERELGIHRGLSEGQRRRLEKIDNYIALSNSSK